MDRRAAFISARSFLFQQMIHEYGGGKPSMRVFRVFWRIATDKAHEFVRRNELMIAVNDIALFRLTCSSLSV